MIARQRFVAIVAAALLAVPNAGWAQPPKVPRVGFLYMVSAEVAEQSVKLKHEAFRELGYVPGKTIVVESRFADNRPERLRQLAAELVTLQVDVIIAGNNATIATAKEATSVIPIVMVAASDPVRAGFVQSLARPGGNVTGLTADVAPETILGKQLALLREIFPELSRVAVLYNPAVPLYRDKFKNAEGLGRQLRLALHATEVPEAAALETAFAAARQHRSQAILVIEDHLMITHYRQIAELAVKHRLPMMGYHREFVEAGALVCYGVNLRALSKRSVYYADRILKGARPADLPVEQPTKFETVVNLQTAKKLGITIPRSVLFGADHVIE